MDDPNSAAAANAVAAGANFWGRVQNLRQNKFQQQQLGIEQQNADTEKSREQLSEKQQNLAQDTYTNVTLPQAQTNLKTANLGLAQAQKTDFLQSHNPVPGAAQSWGQQQAQNFLKNTTPVTDDWQRQQEGPEQAAILDQQSPGRHVVPGYVAIPTPTDAATRQALGVPDGFAGSNWTVSQDKLTEAAPVLTQQALAKAQDEFSKPYDEMSPEAQASVRESYQKSAPPGVKISDAEAATAFRQQQRLLNPPTTPGMEGMVPQSAEYNPADPYSMKVNYAAPVGAPGAQLTPDQFKTYGEPLQKIVSENKELQDAQAKATHVANVISYADEPKPTVSSDKSLIMAYLKSMDPTVRVSEGTVTTVMDGMGIPEEMKNAAGHLMTGQLFTPHHREWFKNAAIQNLDNARRSAADSISSQLAISGATGNPLANSVKLPPSILPPSRKGPGGEGSDAASSGSSAPVSEGVKKFNSLSQAEAANLPKGTEVMIFDPQRGGYRRAISQ